MRGQLVNSMLPTLDQANANPALASGYQAQWYGVGVDTSAASKAQLSDAWLQGINGLMRRSYLREIEAYQQFNHAMVTDAYNKPTPPPFPQATQEERTRQLKQRRKDEFDFTEECDLDPTNRYLFACNYLDDELDQVEYSLSNRLETSKPSPNATSSGAAVEATLDNLLARRREKETQHVLEQLISSVPVAEPTSAREPDSKQQAKASLAQPAAPQSKASKAKTAKQTATKKAKAKKTTTKKSKTQEAGIVFFGVDYSFWR